MSTSSIAATKKQRAACIIQEQCRGYLERRSLAKLRAVIEIQNFWRTHLAQRKVEESLLSRALFEKAVPFVDQLSSLPRAGHGNTPVYYLPGIPVVIKQCGSSEKVEQLANMNLAREICKEKGFTHIVVPLARPDRDFLFVERLLYSSRTKVQVGFYLKNHLHFTQAVKEFSRLYFSTMIPDLVDLQSVHNPYKSLCYPPLEHPFCRYDNLAIYFDKGVGKIGLVDLEGFTPEVSHSTALYFMKCQHLVGIFPMHLHEIFSLARQLDKNIEKSWPTLKKQKQRTLICFNKIYTKHLEFIQSAQIPLENPVRFEPFSPALVEKLRNYLNEKLSKQDEKGSYANCLGRDADWVLEQFNTLSFLPIVTRVYEMIATALIRQAKHYGKIESFEELLDIRTVRFSLSLEVEKMRKMISLLDMFKIHEGKKAAFLKMIIFYILNGLMKFNAIARYYPKFGFPPKQMDCLFC
jgi:hypothetical protein